MLKVIALSFLAGCLGAWIIKLMVDLSMMVDYEDLSIEED